MNLLEKYLSKPDNYQLVGAGGSGKTTSLQYMQQEMLKERINLPGTEEVVIPIYIRMAIFNFRKIENEVLYEYIGSYFELENRRAKELIDNMFQENVGKYRFLIMLDGVNELIDKKGSSGENSVYTKFENDLGSLLENFNVNIICSTRNKEIIFNGNYEKNFRLLEMQPLTQRQIIEYVGNDLGEFDNKFFEEILTTPMLLKMFNVVYRYDKKLAQNLSNKYQLIDNYMIAEKSLREVEGYKDDNQKIRDCILNDILPYIAYYVEKSILSDNIFEKLTFNKLLQNAYEKAKLKSKGYEKKTIEIILGGMNLVSKEMIFSHDLIREFFSFKYWKKLLGERETEEVKEFLNSLILKIMYRSNSEISSRVQNFDLAELILGYYEKELLDKKLQKARLGEEESLVLVQNFYQEIAGVYDDLGRQYAPEATKYGWMAYQYLEKCKKLYNEYELAQKTNYIAFCTLKGNAVEKSWELLERAEQLVTSYKQKCSNIDKKMEEDIKNLLGKIYSNKGAFYYSVSLGNSYETAIKYHEKALEERCEGKHVSYKNIMSAYFKLEDFKTAYENYQKALKELKIENSVSEWYITRYKFNQTQFRTKTLADLIERGIGVEMNLLSDNELRDKIQKELCYEIPYVFDYFSTGSRRKDRDSLISLRDKLKGMNEKDLAFETKIVVKDYLKKCNEILGEI